LIFEPSRPTLYAISVFCIDENGFHKKQWYSQFLNIAGPLAINISSFEDMNRPIENQTKCQAPCNPDGSVSGYSVPALMREYKFMPRDMTDFLINLSIPPGNELYDRMILDNGSRR